MMRAIAVAAAIFVAVLLLCVLAGGVLAGPRGAELGLIVGAIVGWALAMHYCADMLEIAAAKRKLQAAQTPQNQESRLKAHRRRILPARAVFLQDRRSRLTGSRHAPYTSQKHHDLQLSDIGIRRKRKSKR